MKEVLSSDFSVKKLLVTSRYEDEFGKHNPVIVPTKVLESLGTLQTNDSCLAVVQIPERKSELDEKNHLLLFDGISDPGNLGTIIRTADWFGFSSIVCSPDSVDQYNPKVINATKGSFTRVVVQYHDLAQLIISLESRDVFGLYLEGENILRKQFTNPSIFVFGSESHGIKDKLSQYIKRKVTIPGRGKAESLNLSVSAGIVMSHLRL